MAKRKDAPYRLGSRSGWIKVKTEQWKAANRYRPNYVLHVALSSLLIENLVSRCSAITSGAGASTELGDDFDLTNDGFVECSEVFSRYPVL